MIKIICLGKIKEEFYKDAITEYTKRLSKYTKLEIIELEDINDKDINYALTKEKERIKKEIKFQDNVIILDPKGNEYQSEEFATVIDKELTYNSNITFIIGSSNGLADEIKNITTKKISFSKMTFPHQLFRVILLEQIYRAFKINNNEQYHK